MDPTRIEAINADLLERTGIDFSRYRNPELTEAVGSAMTFPLYLGKALTRPVGLMLLLLLIAFVLAQGAFLKTLLVFPGLLLTIAIGVLLGLVLFVKRVRADMKNVFDISSNLCVQALRDIDTSRARLAGGGRLPGALEIFQGLNAIVVLPMVIDTLKRRVPFAGGLGARLTERFFGLVDRRLAAMIDKRSPDAPAGGAAQPAEAAAWLDSAERAVTAVQANVARVVDGVGRVVAFPFLAALIVTCLVSLGLYYAAWLTTA